jgi:sulfur-carrier protein
MQSEQSVGHPVRPAAPTPQEGGMPAGEARAHVTVRYWAGARAAAGTDADRLEASTVGDAIDGVVALHPALRAVTVVSTILVDGRPAAPDQPLGEGAVLEVLPPFAGG